MSLLSQLATLVDSEFEAVLPALNAVVIDMTQNYSAWQANPVIKSTEAVTTIVNPVAGLDMQAVLGAVSLVQALWQVFGSTAATAAKASASVTLVQPAAAPTTLQATIAAQGQTIPDQQPSHM